MDSFVGGGFSRILLWFHQSFASRFQVNLAYMLVFLSFLLLISFSIRHRYPFSTNSVADNIRS